MTIKPGINVASGKDYTLYALESGIVTFDNKNKQSKRVNIQ
jgi:ribosomal protein L27